MMPFPNVHAARVANPNLFIKGTFKSKSLSDGIRLIAGKLKSLPDKMSAQSYRFNKDNFSPEQAQKWLSDNKIKYLKFEPAVKDIQSMEKDIKLQCYALQLSPQEIKSHIPINLMAEIKEKDDHPYFRAYSTMHEGIARPRVIGENKSLPTKWTRAVIKSAKNIIKKGVQFFIGHNADNSTTGRKSVGEVITTFQKIIGDKLHNIAIGYFPDKIESDKYNVCSIEGGVLAQDYDDYSIIKAVKKVSGIALGNDNSDKPAFPGAVYLGAIQAFDDTGDDNPPSKNKTGKEITMTFEDVKKAIRDLNIFPHQIYTEDDVKNDRTFSKIFEDAEKSAAEGMISKAEHEKLINAKDDELQKLTKSVSIITAQDKLKASLPDGLSKKQKIFIDKNFEKKKETLDDLSDDGIKKFVENSIKEFSEYASLFGADKTENNDDNSPDTSNENLDDIDKIVNEVVNQP